MKKIKTGGQSIENIKCKLLAGVLSLTILSTGCGTVNNGYSENHNNDNLIQNEIMDELNNGESTDKLDISKNMIESLSSNDGSDKFVENENIKEITQDYIENINDINPTYNHEEYFLTKEEVDSIIKSASNDVKCSNIIDSNRKVAIEKLVDQIYQNSVEFVDNNPEYKLQNDDNKECVIPSSYLGYDEKLGYDLKYFLKSALTDIFEKATNDINEDFCLLSETKVVFSSDTLDGTQGDYDAEENQINIYYQNANIKPDATMSDFREEINVIISHEFDHVRQFKCNHRSKNNEYVTINYSNHIPILIESSAESALYNQKIDNKYLSKSTYDYAYILEREDEALLLLMGITNPSIDGYYNSIFDSDPQALYNYFQLDSDDIETFYRILYSIDTKYFRTDLSIDMFPELTSTYYELEKILGNDYRIDIFRLALKNLARYTSSHPDFSLKDNLTLFNVIKNTLIHDIYFKDDEEINDYDFLSRFSYLERFYIEFISDIYNVSMNEIRKIEQIYYDCPMDIEDDAKESKLITQFPTLNAIFDCMDLPVFGYDIFLQESQLNLKRTSIGN